MTAKSELKRIWDLSPGDMFRRQSGEFRYVVSPSRSGKGGGDVSVFCYNLDGKSIGYWMNGHQYVVPLPVEGSELEAAPKFFYMCYAEGQGVPTMKHYSAEDAKTEAERLMWHTGCRVFLLKATACVDRVPPVPKRQLCWRGLS